MCWTVHEMEASLPEHKKIQQIGVHDFSLSCLKAGETIGVGILNNKSNVSLLRDLN